MTPTTCHSEARRGIYVALADSVNSGCYHPGVQSFYVYMMASKSRTLYVGMTNDLERRVFEHKNKLVPGFTSKYNITKLVWFDEFDEPLQAIEGEKRIKGRRREKKVALIEKTSPDWSDLALNWLVHDKQVGSGDPSVAEAPSG